MNDAVHTPAPGMTAGMNRRQTWVTAGLAVLILVPSMYGFVGKFVEFVHIYRGSAGGEFAVAPILNYLLASAGFFCMLLWAGWNGMFRDVERPKVEFLENERLLDRNGEHGLDRNGEHGLDRNGEHGLDSDGRT